MLRLPSKNTTWNLTVAALSEVQPNCWRFLHSITSSLLGPAPATAQKTFWPVPATGKRSSHHGATKAVACEVGTAALEHAVNEPVEFTFLLLLTKRVVRVTPPSRIGTGDVQDREIEGRPDGVADSVADRGEAREDGRVRTGQGAPGIESLLGDGSRRQRGDGVAAGQDQVLDGPPVTRRVLGLQQRSHPGDVRRGHRRPAE